MRTFFVVIAVSLASEGAALIGAVPSGPGVDRFATRIAETVRADYRGETGRLRELAGAFAADTSSAGLGAWAHYWRGFALQRRAFNLMNDEPKSLEARDDLRAAALEFARVESHAILRADAQSSRAACIMSLGATAGSADSIRASIREYLPLLDAAVETDPHNPRVLWVRSMSVFFKPAKFGGGPDSAIAMMAHGGAVAHERARAGAAAAAHPYAPAWGEPEALANLAWFWYARQDAPDLDRAQAYAEEALMLAPEWHFLRDILMKQIADRRATGTLPP